MREDKPITALAETAAETKADEKKETQESVAAAEIAQAAETTRSTRRSTRKTEPKRNIWAAVATAAGIIVFFIVIIGLVAYRLNSKTPTDNKASSTVVEKSSTDTTGPNIAPKEDNSIKPPVEDEEKYKGWQTYENQSWAIFFRYPAEWTKTEVSGSLDVTVLGPPTPGGAVLNECAVGVFIEDVPESMTVGEYEQAERSEPSPGSNVLEATYTSVGPSEALKVIDTYTDNGAPWKRQRILTIKNERAYTFSYKASINYGGTDYYTIHSATADMILASVIIP